MGTHPIFESDFDCLTDSKENRESVKTCERWNSAHQTYEFQTLKKKIFETHFSVLER